MASAQALSRQDAITIIAQHSRPEDLIVAATGMIARELYVAADRPGNFYMQGSMGHAMNIGLGLSEGAKNNVIVLDGDGALLMHMGSMSTIGHYKPDRLIHVVLDNGVYGTTGNQASTSALTDTVSVAEACGYASAKNCSMPGELKHAFMHASTTQGPHYIRVRINSVDSTNIPRITERYSPTQNARRFSQFATAGLVIDDI